MEPPHDFKSLQEGVQKSLVSTVKTVNRLAAEDLSFQRTVNPDTAEQLDDNAARLLRLSTRLLSAAANACNVKSPKLEDAEDIELRWHAVVDVVDSVLEKADMALDEFTGLIKQRDTSGPELVRRLLDRARLSRLLSNLGGRHRVPRKQSRQAKLSDTQTSPSPKFGSSASQTISRKGLGSPSSRPSLTRPCPWTSPSSRSPTKMARPSTFNSSTALTFTPSHVRNSSLVTYNAIHAGSNTLTRPKSTTCNTPRNCSRWTSPFLLSQPTPPLPYGLTPMRAFSTCWKT